MMFGEPAGEPRLLTPPKRVAIFRALALGDLLCAVPTLRSLRQAWPVANFTLIGLPWAREFAARFSRYVDRFIEFPGWPGLPEREPQIDQIPAFLASTQREQYDLAIQLQGSGTIVNSLVALFGARQAAGFFPPSYYCPDGATFAPWPEKGLEVHRLLRLVDRLGLPRAGEWLEFPLNAGDRRRAAELIEQHRASNPYVIVHPGASAAERRWDAGHFAAVADRLAARGYEIVLTGVASERVLTGRVAAAMNHVVIDVSGQTDLGSLSALVDEAALVIANDTGISHLAAAVGTPSVIVSTGDNPARWAPTNAQLHRVLCPARDTSVEAVVAAAMAQLEDEPAQRHARGALLTV
jgi:ADP-heptose:LPS heptosyltransferase